MPHYRIEYVLKGDTTIYIEPKDIDKVETYLNKIEKGTPPKWLKKQLISGIKLNETEIEDVFTTDGEPSAEEELDFEG